MLGAVTMSLGWGLRGSIGGGSLGAMIPGAMIGLVLCLMLGRQSDSGLIVAFAAIGVGFGGQETYGQTVGLSLQPDTFWWAILGFVIKGAAWGLLGGAFIGLALDRPHYTNRQLLAGFVIMVIGTWLGWRYLNNPKLIYFSNRLDQPREELWAGLWLGGLLLLAWLRSRVPSMFALYGAIGGGIGFGVGASLQPMGRAVWAGMPLGWWKAMELTFGALLGLAYVLCAWSLRQSTGRRIDRRRWCVGPALPRAFLAAAMCDCPRDCVGPIRARPLRLHDRRGCAREPDLVFRIARLADGHHGDLCGLRVGLSRLPDLRSASTGVDRRRHHDRRRHDHRRSLSADARHASPVDLGCRGQRLSLFSAAVPVGRESVDDAHGLCLPCARHEHHGLAPSNVTSRLIRSLRHDVATSWPWPPT